MTTCEYDGTERSYNCARYEQCDECYLKDNPLKVKVQHDTGERVYEVVVGEYHWHPEAIQEMEQRWGEPQSNV